jgi:hypothetical protein
METTRKPILCLDFDGVCHSYTTPWVDTHIIPDPPVPGMWRFLERAIHHFDVHIYSSRSALPIGIAAMRQWFLTHAESGYQKDIVNKWLKFPSTKPPAFLTLDDRALLFTGMWPDPITLLDFKPWNKET